MAKAVLDTNIVVSGLRNPGGNAGDILKLAASGAFRCYVSESILSEYEEVLGRASLGLMQEQVKSFLRLARRKYILVEPTREIRVTSDPDDNVFLECALEARADYVVTGNLRHFPPRFQDIRVIRPRQFLSILAAGSY